MESRGEEGRGGGGGGERDKELVQEIAAYFPGQLVT